MRKDISHVKDTKNIGENSPWRKSSNFLGMKEFTHEIIIVIQDTKTSHTHATGY
jgi:hypothetical protein